MRNADIGSWRHEFARSAAWRREQDLFAKEAERRVKQERESERSEDSLDELTTIAIMASEADIQAFRARLDAYDADNTEALLENERLREITRAKIDGMLRDAFVLPDGRRVFKMKDGRVIDEHRVVLRPDEIDPDLIEDWRPGGEDYILALEQKEELDKEHAERLEFQERIDVAREKLEADDLTRQDIREIEDELKTSMPIAARRRTSDPEEAPAANVRGDFTAAASPQRIVVPDLGRDLQPLFQ
jgi:hypothetical protein